MEALFLGFFNRAMAAGWLVLAVLLLRLVFKKAPKWVFCLLWALVGLRLALPWSIESVLSLVPSAEVITETTLYAPSPTITTGVEAINRVVNPVISAALAPNPGDSVNPLQVLAILASYAWAIGLAAMLIYCLVSFLRLRHRVAEAVPEEDGVWVCSRVTSPFILGLFRPRIYLPSGLTEPERSYVLAHERAHLSRRDHWIKPIGFVLLALYWFHPLVWVAYILLCRDIELACDERVIRQLGEGEKKPYSSALLTCSVSRRSIAACPLAFGEVGVKQRIVSILNYKKPAFWVILVAVLSCIVAAVCFLTDPVTELPSPLGQKYRVQEVLYHAPISSTEYRAEYMPVYEIAGDGTLVCHPQTMDSEVVGQLMETELSKEWFDRYCSTREEAEFTQDDAKALRKENYKAWRYADYDDPAQQMYVLLQQKNGDILLFIGWLDSEGENDSYSDDSFFTHVLCLEPTDALPEPQEDQPQAYIAGALMGQHMGLSFMPQHGVDLGYFYLAENLLCLTDSEETTRIEFELAETQQLSPEELETKLTESGILLILEKPEGEVTLQRYFSKEENTNIELFFFSDRAAWINLNLRIFEFVPEGTPIVPTQWPSGEDVPADDLTFQERLDELLHTGDENPLGTAIMSVIQKYNHQERGGEIFSLTSYKILEQATVIACGADEESSYTEEQLLLAALYQEFDPAIGGMEPVTERFCLMVVKFEELENGTYEETFFWQNVNTSEWDYEQVRQWFPLGISGQFHDFSIGGKERLFLELQNIHYSALSKSGMIDAQWEIRYLLDSIMDGYQKLGNNTDFQEEYLDEWYRILCYGDETLRFVLREFMYGGQTDYRGVLLEEFLLRLMPETSIDLYTETPQEYFDSWRRFMFREYDRLGEDKAFEMYPRMPVFLEVMAEFESVAE